MYFIYEITLSGGQVVLCECGVDESPSINLTHPDIIAWHCRVCV